jgi:hypothetical protein
MPLLISCATGKRAGTVGGKEITVTVTDPSDALERASGRAAGLFSTAFGLLKGLGWDSACPCTFPAMAENVATAGAHKDCGRRIRKPTPIKIAAIRKTTG